jgi:pyridoxamine 5'-phosphate oxidase
MESINRFLQLSRIQYDQGIVSENHLVSDPLDQFLDWMQEAIQSNVAEPNAMDLCTVAEDGRPSSRIVLLKGIDQRGFLFYTNYTSRKAQEIMHYPYACLNFFWQSQSRQVRVEGKLQPVPDEESDAYFATRPRESQLGAWASRQSTVIQTRQELEDELMRLEQHYSGLNVPRPPHWGGYVLEPDRVEFWQGRPNRLHDRFQYLKTEKGWQVFRLSP